MIKYRARLAYIDVTICENNRNNIRIKYIIRMSSAFVDGSYDIILGTIDEKCNQEVAKGMAKAKKVVRKSPSSYGVVTSGGIYTCKYMLHK
jgi:hypothetical protein